MKHIKLHQFFFYIFLFLLPFQTRILYNPENAYINGVFNYYLGFFLYLSDLVLILCFTIWLLFDPPNPKIVLERKYRLILAFFGLILVTLFHPPTLSELRWAGVKHLDLGVYQALKWLELWLLFAYISYNFARETMFHRMFHKTLWILFITGVIQAGIGIGQFHVKHSLSLGFLGEYVSQIGTAGLATIDFAGEKLIRAYGTMPHPNVLGGFLILALISGFFLVSRETTKAKGSPFLKFKGLPFKVLKWFVSLGIIAILLGIFFSFSRVAWISAILAILTFLWFHVKHKNWSKVIVIVIVIVILFGTIGLGYGKLLSARTAESSVSQALDYRTQFNTYGWEFVKQYPILGVGVGQYIPALQDLHKLQPWQYQPPHNIFIFLAAELGILGLIIFLLILWKIFKQLAVSSSPRIEILSLISRRGLEVRRNSLPHQPPGAGRDKAYNLPPLAPPILGGESLLRFTLLLTGLIFLFIGSFDHYLLTIQQGRLMLFTVLGLIAAAGNLELHNPIK